MRRSRPMSRSGDEVLPYHRRCMATLVTAPPTEREAVESMHVLVLGAGLGGLLAAVGLARQGHKPVVVERSHRPGGRFTSSTVGGAQVSTGALHLVPHGDGGPLAQLLKQLDVKAEILKTDAHASFLVHGRQKVVRHTHDWLTLFGPFTTVKLIRLLLALRQEKPPRPMSMADWLRENDAPTSLIALFEAFTEFALALTLQEVSVGEVRAIVKSIFRYGLPGVPAGGCKGIIDALVEAMDQAGGEMRLREEVERLEFSGDRIVQVTTRDRASGKRHFLRPDLVISDLGPQETMRLAGVPAEQLVPRPPTGLKVHVLTSRSLIPHQGILFCLDGTDRVSGFAQPSNAEPRLAPPGKHLVISFQVMRSADLEAEKRLALQDWHMVFGDEFSESDVIAVTSYPADWPVNWLPQGSDLPVSSRWSNLLLVGDGHKTPGRIMVEGVADSASRALASVPSRLRV